MFAILYRLTIPATALPASEAALNDEYLDDFEFAEINDRGGRVVCPDVAASPWLVTRDGRSGSTCLN